jgi:NAD(P)-dependent dehydrogenase (short-subunit alcohol dehydrogenase family)
LDVAFNNAGITGEAHRVEDYPSDEFDRVVRVNLKSVFLGMKYEPLMARGGGGAICNTASVAALTGPGGAGGHRFESCRAHDSFQSFPKIDSDLLIIEQGDTIQDYSLASFFRLFSSASGRTTSPRLAKGIINRIKTGACAECA